MIHCLDTCLLSDLFIRAPVIVMPQQSQFSKRGIRCGATGRRIVADGGFDHTTVLKK
jgi:hypothetical protein